MESFIDQLFSGYEAFAARPMSEEYKAALHDLNISYKNRSAMTESEFDDQISNAHAKMLSISTKDAFREGFLIGGRLMIELLTPHL